MQTWVEQWLPEEACGLLAGIERRVTLVMPIENQLHSPVRFSMEPRAQLKAFLDIDQENLQLVGIFHSHPAGPAHPSYTDIEEFYYPGAVSVIWSRQGGVWQARGFWIDAGSSDEVPLIITSKL